MATTTFAPCLGGCGRTSGPPERFTDDVADDLGHDIADQEDDEEANELRHPLEELVPSAIDAVAHTR